MIENMDKVMPIWFAASIFLGVFSACMGVWCARAIAVLVSDFYNDRPTNNYIEVSGGRDKRDARHWRVGEL